MNIEIMTDPPWPSARVRELYEPAFARAACLLERPDAYALRVGVETPKSTIEALADAAAMALMGLGDHVEATAACCRCPLVVAAAVNLAPMYSVGSAVVRAFQKSTSSTELRTPPEAWTSAPPDQLFEPGVWS